MFCLLTFFGGCLDGTSRNHLLAEVVLVGSDRVVPSANSLVLTDHDVLGNLVEQSIELPVSILVIQDNREMRKDR